VPAIAVLVPSIRRGAEVCSPCVPPGMPHVASRAARVRGCRARSSLRLALARIFPLPLGCRGGEQGERACGVEWSGVVDERKRAGVGCGNRGYVVPRGKPSMYLGMGRLASVGGSTLSSERVVTSCPTLTLSALI